MSSAGATDEDVAIDRLQRHAGESVAGGSVPDAERGELIEELYSGLWERWRAEIEAGASVAVAADRAIAAFGGPVELGRDLAAVYYSRLYAATFGSLLPAALVSRAWPVGLRRSVGFMVMVSAFAALGAIASFAVVSPTRAIVVSILSAATAVVWALCARALVRGQRWALAVARLTVVLALVTAAGSLLAHDVTINLIGIVALVAMWPLFGQDLAAWVSQSRPIGRRLGLGLAVIPLAAAAATVFPTALPELTAVTANDLRMDVSALCERSGTTVTSINVAAVFSWDHLDPWPRGLRPAEPPQDRLSAWLEGAPAIGVTQTETIRNGHRYFQPLWMEHGVRDQGDPEGLELSGLSIEPPSSLDEPKPDSAVGAGLATSVRTGELQAGHRYEVIWEWAFNPQAVAESIDRVVVTYDHLGQVGRQAVTSCNEIKSSVPIDPPFALP